MRAKHYVYVVELSKDVLFEAKFIKSNPDYVLRPTPIGIS